MAQTIKVKTQTKGKQTKGRLDVESLKKIGRGILVYALGATALYVLGRATPILNALGVNNPAMVSILAAITPAITKIIKEWMKGE